jgi:hypothetical protein
MKNREEVWKAERVIETEMESEKWMSEIPFLDFPSDIKIRPIPNFGGSVVRFIAGKGEDTVSVYLDCYRRLGACDHPYWEVYPDYYNDVFRCPMENDEELVEAIVKALNGRAEYEY